ncbi:MAG: copper chaperone PCu(A)C [Pseudorhodoplanes sp.]
MMLKSIVLAACLACGLQAASARDFTLGSLTVGAPWLRATPKGASVAGGYLAVTNKGAAADRLIGGTAAFSGRVEIHEMKMDNGVMRMRPVPGGLEIKPGETLRLEPGALHLMFLDLKAPLQAGQPVRGTLLFEKAGSVAIEYDVVPPGSRPAAGGHSGH